MVDMSIFGNKDFWSGKPNGTTQPQRQVVDPYGGAFVGVQGAMQQPQVPTTTPAAPAAPSNTNAAMVNALRQKPARFSGFGMGLGTNASAPKASNVSLSSLGSATNPGGLFNAM